MCLVLTEILQNDIFLLLIIFSVGDESVIVEFDSSFSGKITCRIEMLYSSLGFHFESFSGGQIRRKRF